MAASVVIIVVSAVLFAYWFRYTCALILNANSAKNYASEVAVENRLSFPGVEARLATSGAEDLQPLELALQRDYQVVMQLLKQAGQLSIAGGGSLEDVMLKVNYWFLRRYYGISLRVSEVRAREALAEMCQIVGYFANTFGERVVAVPTAK